MAFDSMDSGNQLQNHTDGFLDRQRRISSPTLRWPLDIWRKALRTLPACAFSVGILLLPAVSKGQGQRLFKVRDSIEKVTFVGDSSDEKQVSKFSPDGRLFFVITTRGILQSNQLESTVWLFESSAVTNALKRSSATSILVPRALVKMATVSNGDPISNVRWAADSGSITFLGRNHGSERHLFVVTLKDGRLQQLSPEGQDVTSFDRANDAFVFTTVPAVTETELYQSGGLTLPDIQRGTGSSIFGLLYPEWEDFTFGGHPREVWHVSGGKAAPVAESGESAPISLVCLNYGAVLSLSPNGRYAVVTNAVAQVPASWESYESGYPFVKILADKPNVKQTIGRERPTQYDLVDLQSGKISALIDAPLGISTGFEDASIALWSPDSSEVLLTNTFLPLEGGSVSEFRGSKRPWVVAVDIASRKIAPIKETPIRKENTSLELTALEWQMPDRKLVLRYVDTDSEITVEPELFQKKNGVWNAMTDPAAIKNAAKRSTGHEFSVAVHESLNEPPVLMATSATTRESKKIWDPNPKFGDIQFGEAIIYKWHDKTGHVWTGGLLKPPDYANGRRYPLVIQTHGFNEKQFLTDGAFPTAMAARPMAARGMIVLQVGGISIPPASVSTPREVEAMREGYLAGIEQLAADGLVDPHKVGIIGFSRTGWYVLNSLLHAKKYFGAATLAECTYTSFWEYLINADYFPQVGAAKQVASSVGPEPFGEGLQKWITDSAGFNADKIDIPVFFEANSPALLIASWDMYAAMRLLNKPVELLYMRNGDHVLRKPLERLASQEMNVDWYDFWLNGHEDPDPAKADQYARWRELRKLQEQNEVQGKVQSQN